MNRLTILQVSNAEGASDWSHGSWVKVMEMQKDDEFCRNMSSAWREKRVKRQS